MATIAAAATDDATGIAGVAYAGVQVMPVQVLDADGVGQDGDIIAGVVAAADAGADVILMAFSSQSYSLDLQDAINYAWGKGAVLVAATGNDALATPSYPAGDAKVVGVSATDSSDALWSGSNYGADVFLGAPGVDVLAGAVGGGTTSITGTSASAAIVAGAAAMIRANDPSASNGVIVGRLARNADAAGTVDQTGNGRVNLNRALTDISTDAVVPTGSAPSGTGGPFVGPYVAAANNDAHVAPGWAPTNTRDHLQHALPQDDRWHRPARADHAARRLHEHQRCRNGVLVRNLEHAGHQPSEPNRRHSADGRHRLGHQQRQLGAYRRHGDDATRQRRAATPPSGTWRRSRTPLERPASRTTTRPSSSGPRRTLPRPSPS